MRREHAGPFPALRLLLLGGLLTAFWIIFGAGEAKAAGGDALAGDQGSGLVSSLRVPSAGSVPLVGTAVAPQPVTSPSAANAPAANPVSTPVNQPVQPVTAPVASVVNAVTVPVAPVLNTLTAPVAPVLDAVTLPAAPVLGAVTAPVLNTVTAPVAAVVDVIAAPVGGVVVVVAGPVAPVLDAVIAPVAGVVNATAPKSADPGAGLPGALVEAKTETDNSPSGPAHDGERSTAVAAAGKVATAQAATSVTSGPLADLRQGAITAHVPGAGQQQPALGSSGAPAHSDPAALPSPVTTGPGAGGSGSGPGAGQQVADLSYRFIFSAQPGEDGTGFDFALPTAPEQEPGHSPD